LHRKFSLTSKAPQRMGDSALYRVAMTRGMPSFSKGSPMIVWVGL
jgi:hypothetical protein